MSRVHRAGRVVLAGTAGLGLACVLTALAMLLLGLTPVVVQSGSMSPAIDTGTLLLTHDEPAGQARVGDVVTVVQPDGDRLTHRVVTASPAADGRTELQLKGDANAAPDAQTAVVREVGTTRASVPWLGGVVAWFSRGPGLLVAAALVAVLVSVAVRRPPTPPGSAGTHRGGRRAARARRTDRAPRRRAVARAVRLGAAVIVVGASPAAAAWNDSATVTGATLTTTTIKPALGSGASCSAPGGAGTSSTTWTTSTVPGVVYTGQVTESPLTPVTITSSATSTTASFRNTQAVMANFTTARLVVTATKGGWTATSTRTYAVTLGIPTACRDWS